VVALGATVVVAAVGTVVATPGTVVVFIGIVCPGAVVPGKTSSVTSESSVYFEARHAPGLTGAVPNADAIDATRTLRPASDGCTRSLFNRPG
jgi:hypothetical protein